MVGEGFAPKFGEVWVKRIGGDDTEWIDSKGIERDIERHSMAGSKIRVKR